jgi:FKBP12-rapamycin complex-associated protein
MKRGYRWKLQYFHKLWNNIISGFNKKNDSIIHGNLLVLGELMDLNDEFMICKFKNISEIIWKYFNYNNHLIIRTVLSLLPKLANLNINIFVNEYLNLSLEYIIKEMQHEK